LLIKAEVEPDARTGDGAGDARGLEFLRGRTVNLSEVGSGTYDLAREVLAFAGLRPPGEAGGAPGDYTPKTLSYTELLAEPDRAPGGLALDPALLDLPPELDWHDGTVAFRERNKPLIIGDAVDFLEKGTSLVGGLLGGGFFLWQWYRQRRRRRRELGFESYML